MWDVRRITDAPVELLLTGSGQGPLTTRSLTADGDLLVPYTCLVDCSSNPVQLSVCTHCCEPYCADGGWVTLRSLGDAVVLLPRFDIQEPDDLERYGPPEPIKRRGAVILRGAVLDAARQLLLTLPSPESLPALEAGEAVMCLKFEAPEAILGPGQVVAPIDRGVVLACSEDDVGALLDEADALLRDLAGRKGPAVVQSLPGVPVTLYLDGPGTPTWSPFARLESGRLALHLSEKFDVVGASSTRAA